MAVGALLRRLGIVERPRALPRHARGLPVVVVVESTEPAVPVHGHVEMHLVTARTELGGLLAMERFEERLSMRLRIDREQLVVEIAKCRLFAGGQVVQRRILDDEIALAHRALDVRDGVTRGASQPGLRFRRLDLFPDGPIEATVEEHRVIVAARAPLGRFGPDHVLHVLDGLAIPLIVERRETVCRRLPLLIDVGVTAPAALAGQEEIGRDDRPDVGLGRRGEERAGRTAALLIHARRHDRRVLDAVRRSPGRVVAQPRAGSGDQDTADERQRREGPSASSRLNETGGNAGQVSHEQRRARRRQPDVRVQQPPVGTSRAPMKNREAEDQAEKQQACRRQQPWVSLSPADQPAREAAASTRPSTTCTPMATK